LSTVRHADKIIVIDNGRVIEEGNHETLMKLQSNYYSLVKAQVLQQPFDDNIPHLSELTPFIGKITLLFFHVLHKYLLFRKFQ
jgi:ABC-type dipeptide/oligopeptide/nickel transport system ATPase component